jgi:hypothetical protein
LRHWRGRTAAERAREPASTSPYRNAMPATLEWSRLPGRLGGPAEYHRRRRRSCNDESMRTPGGPESQSMSLVYVSSTMAFRLGKSVARAHARMKLA